MPLTVGLTGNIGSGKTTVSRLFACLGVPVYYADDAGKRLMREDEELKAAVQARFGAAIYKEGELDRAALAAIVFNDAAELKALEALVHPAVFKDSIAWGQRHLDAPYLLREAALTFESGSYKLLDKVIVVTASEAERVRRVISRDGVTAEQVRARMDKQWKEEKKMEMADFVINNEGTELLIPQVLEIHHKMIKGDLDS